MTHDAPPGFELEQDLRFQRVAWRVERVSWLIMALIVVAALAGVFGGGPLGHARAGAAGDPLRIEYDRFARVQSNYTVRADAVVSTGASRLELRFGSDFLDMFHVEQITPAPISWQLTGDGAIAGFDVKGGESVRVQVDGRFSRAGRVNAEFSRPGGPALRCTILVYP